VKRRDRELDVSVVVLTTAKDITARLFSIVV
jgi:hypothetical protein